MLDARTSVGRISHEKGVKCFKIRCDAIWEVQMVKEPMLCHAGAEAHRRAPHT